jgi:hypothetical protein
MLQYVDEGGNSFGGPTAPNQRQSSLVGVPAPPGGAANTPLAPLAPSGNELISNTLAKEAYDRAIARLNNQRSQLYTQYGLNPDGTRDPSNKYGLYQQNEYQYGQSKSRLEESKSRFLESFERDFGRTQRDAGFKANLNADGTLKGISLDGNENSRFRQMLTNQAYQEMDLEDAAAARGLGSSGLGARDLVRAEGQNRSERGSYRTNVIDSLTDLLTGKKQGIEDFTRQFGDLDYQKGLNEFNLTTAFQNALSGINFDEADRLGEFNRAKTEAARQSVIDRITEGDFTPAPTPAAPSGGDGGGGKAPVLSQGVKWGGQTFTTKAQLSKWLANHGTSWSVWAKNHPDAAKKLT